MPYEDESRRPVLVVLVVVYRVREMTQDGAGTG
jgi:hypothetical protein